MEEYFAIIVVATAVIGLALFLVLRMLLSTNKTNNIFNFKPSVLSVDESKKSQRPIDGFGKIHFFLSALNDGSANDVTVLFMKSRVPLEASIVKKALLLVQKRYPLLRMRVNSFSLMFQEMQDRLKVHFKTVDECQARDWIRVFQEESRIPFDVDQGPLWRVSMLKEHFDGDYYENCLLFTFHHMICDGASIMALYNTFLEYLNDLQKGNTVNVESMALMPPLDHLIGHKVRPSLLEKCLFKMLPTLLKVKNMLVKPAQNVYLAAFSPPILQDPSIIKKTSLIPVVLKKDELSKLMVQGRKHGCTFHSVITAATRLAMAQILNTGSAKSTVSNMVSFVNGFPISLRNDVQPPISKEEFGLFISVLFMDVPTPTEKVTPKTFWDFTKQCHASLKKLTGKDDRLKILKLVNNVDVKMFLSLGNSENFGRFDPAFNISNRGRFVIGKPTDVFQFAGTYFAMAEHTKGPPFTHNVVSVNGDLYWGLVYYPHIATKEQAQHILELAMDNLKVAASSAE